MAKRLTYQEFVNKSDKIHKKYYTYKNFIYRKNNIAGYITCPKHGDFLQTPATHFNGGGCTECHNEKTRLRKTYTLKQWIDKFIETHGTQHYDYSGVKEIKSSRHKIPVKCNKHNIFFKIRADVHKMGQGCNKCNGGVKITHDEFVINARKIHGDEFIYLENYKKYSFPILMKHKTCQSTFYKSPGNHIENKQGCPYCNESNGEKEIRKFLEKYKIKFIRQKNYKDCKGKVRTLPFDFAVVDNLNNIICLIEYDGEGHFYPIRFNGMNLKEAKEKFKTCKRNDKIKNMYCKKNKIELIRISYRQFNDIENILIKKILSQNV